MIAFVFS